MQRPTRGPARPSTGCKTSRWPRQRSVKSAQPHTYASVCARESWLTRWDLSFSPLHSHSLWHCGVWATECLYLLVYYEGLERRSSALA